MADARGTVHARIRHRQRSQEIGSSGKRRGAKRLSGGRPDGHVSNRASITLLKTTELTVRQYFDAVRGCPYDEVKWRRPCRT